MDGGNLSTFAYDKLILRSLMMGKSVVRLNDDAWGIAGVQTAIGISRGRRQDTMRGLISNLIPTTDMIPCRDAIAYNMTLMYGVVVFKSRRSRHALDHTK